MPTVSYGIANTADDAFSSSTLNSDEGVIIGNLSAVFGSAYPLKSLFRFLAVAVPQGATIDTATLSLTYNPSGPSGLPVGQFDSNSGPLYGVAQDNVASTAPTSIGSLPKTTASTDVINATGTFTVDVTAQVAEITSRAGWASGNALAFVTDGTSAGSAFIEVYDYSSSTSQAAQLSITYSTGGGSPTLNDLTLDNSSVVEAASVGSAVGSLVGLTSGSTPTLTDDASGRFALDGTTIEVASALTPGSYDIEVTETLTGATNTPNISTITITVTEAPLIQYVGSQTGTNTLTLPGHQAGDLILLFAYRDGSNTAPSVPTGQNWTTVQNPTGANTNSHALAAKVATSSSEGVGTFTSATTVIAHVYRPKASYVLAIGAVATPGTGSSTTVTYPALTLQDTVGDSVVVGFAGHRSTNTTLETPPAGMVNRSTAVDGTDEAAGHDTNTGVSSWSATAVSVGGTSSGWRATTVEVKVAPDLPPITGSLTATLAASALSAAAAVLVAGSLVATLAPATVTASGQVLVTGSASATLAPSTVSASGQAPITGSLSATLAPATVSATGSVGNPPIDGSLNATLAPSTLEATGQVIVSGSASVMLAPSTLSAQGSVPITGQASATLAASTLSGSGSVPVTGSASTTLQPSTVEASGSVPVSGSATVSLAPATLNATAVVPVSGSLTATLQPATLDAYGASVDVIIGTLNVTLAPSTVAATGQVQIQGAASSTLSPSTLSAQGQVGITGAANASLSPSTLSGVGSAPITGNAALGLSPATVEASGAVPVIGSLSATLQPATVEAFGTSGELPDVPPERRITLPGRDRSVALPGRLRRVTVSARPRRITL